MFRGILVKAFRQKDLTLYLFLDIMNCTFAFKHVFAAAEGGKIMSEIRVKENESLDNALKRFKRQCSKSGVLSEVRKREHYIKPSVKRKKKSEAARKRKF